MRVAEIRSRFLEYFRDNGHTIVPSSPVVPHDDPTLLFANAGMNQFKSVFIGEEERDYVRAASTQKCIRAGGKHNDLENVGYTARHLTFFEMLGNFSFGDYFKSDACRFGWDLLTKGFGIDPDRLWISIFHEDDEARAVWRDEVGIPEARILGLGEKDNYWSMGDVGPCGPCSEIHFDRGPEASCGPECGLGVCDCDRYLEVWNLVFMQFEQKADGTKVPLPKPSIDTGMGLERIALVLQGADTVYQTDVLASLIQEIARLTGAPYDDGPDGTPHRVISDHVRSLSFAIADGAFPSNEDRGYVLRRILRRAARYGYKLGVEEPFIHRVVPKLVDEMGEAFPELREQQATIEKLVLSEEQQFGRTLKMGMARFDEEVAGLEEGDEKFPADAAFFLHDTCGFPIDLTEQMAREIGLSVDRVGFEKLMEAQRERSRQTVQLSGALIPGRKQKDDALAADPTEFIGYRELEGESEVTAARVNDGGNVQLVIATTPFYGESGGQVGDTGEIHGDDFRLAVTDTRKTPDGVYVHQCELVAGDAAAIATGTRVTAAVDGDRRADIIRNHTATHLLHAALRQVLGKHVAQKGSLVAPDRLRFDISHFAKIEPQQLEEVESIVQDYVLRDVELVIEDDVPKEDAMARGAMALFGEKYGDRVRVVEIPGFSVELCGGTHCARTGEIGGFLIINEGSVSSGVRRVEAFTGGGTSQRVREDESLLKHLGGLLRSSREELVERVEALLAENKELRSGQAKQSRGDLVAELDGGAGERRTVNGCEIITAHWDDVEMEELLVVADTLKRRQGERVFILATAGDSGVRFVVGVSQALAKGRVHSGEVARGGAQALGGGGGGRPDLAQAGGKETAKLAEALAGMTEDVARRLAESESS